MNHINENDRVRILEDRLSELAMLDEARNQFISLASHELRTPIAVVNGIAATLICAATSSLLNS